MVLDPFVTFIKYQPLPSLNFYSSDTLLFLMEHKIQSHQIILVSHLLENRAQVLKFFSLWQHCLMKMCFFNAGSELKFGFYYLLVQEVYMLKLAFLMFKAG